MDNGKSLTSYVLPPTSSDSYVPDFIRYRSEYERNLALTIERKRAERAESRLRFCAVAACAAVAILMIAKTITTKNTYPGRDRPLISFQAPGPFSPLSGSLSRHTGEGQGGGQTLNPKPNTLPGIVNRVARLEANEATNGKTLEDIWKDHTNRLSLIEKWLTGADSRAILPRVRPLAPSPASRENVGERVPNRHSSFVIRHSGGVRP